MQKPALIRLESVTKVFYADDLETHALDGVHLDVGEGEFVSISGPSGCGKSTLLALLGLLDTPTEGRYLLGGEDVSSLSPAVRARVRNERIGFIFQAFNLIGDLTVLHNVELPLTYRDGLDAGERRNAALQALERVGMSHRVNHHPAQLSGGQQQRVAMARALAVNPALLLLDEPLSALDARVRHDLRTELTDVQRQLGIPTLMVTHDQAEAMSMADRIVCMNKGRIEQVGSPQQLYLQPRTRFVANFMGQSNLLSFAQLQLLWPDLLAQAPAGLDTATAAVCLRPEKLRVKADPAGTARVVSSSFLGSIQHLTIARNGQTLLAEVDSTMNFDAGQPVQVEVLAQDCAWLQS